MALTEKTANRKDISSGSRMRGRTGAPTMQHRQFSIVAATLREYFAKNNCSPELREDMIDHWADAMAATNPKFDRGRFVLAVLA